MINVIYSRTTKKFRLWFRLVSIITAWTFLFMQVAWAQDMNPLGPAPIDQEDNRANMLSPDQLLDAQKRAKALIDIKNGIDSFHDSASNTIADNISGDLSILHEGDNVYQISAAGSFTIDAIQFSEEMDSVFKMPFSFDSEDDPVAENSYIRLSMPDGTMHLYEYSPSLSDVLSQEKLVETITSSNTMITYSNGLVDTILKSDGDISRYTYVFDEANFLTDIVQSKYDATRVFDSSGELEKIYVATMDGYVEVSYKDGSPHILTKADGTSYLYTYPEQDGEALTCITLLRYMNEDGSQVDFENGEPVDGSLQTDRNTALLIVQGPDGLIREVRDIEGAVFYYENGIITRSVDALGEETLYSYEYDDDGNLVKTIIKKGAVTIEYDENGDIIQAFVGEGAGRMTVEFSFGKISKVTSNENIIFYTYEEDPDTGEEITRVEAYSTHVRTKYDDSGLLSELTFPDGTVIRYARDETGCIMTSEVYNQGIISEIYNYSYDGELIIIEDQFRAKRVYDPNYDLIGIITPQGYYYLYLQQPDGSSRLVYMPDEGDQYPPMNIEYRYTASGELVATKRNDGTTITFFQGKVANLLNEEGDVLVGYTYDADGNLLNAGLVSLRQLLEEAQNKADLDIEDETLFMLDTLSGIAQIGHESVAHDGEDFAQQSGELRGTLEDLRTQVKNGADYPIIDGGIADLDDFDSTLPGELDAAREEIDGYLIQKTGEVQAASDSASLTVLDENITLLREVLDEEIVPFVSYYYNEILGRTPTEEEIAPWKGKSLSEVQEGLIAYLLSSEEYIAKLAQRDAIISEVGAFLEDYTSAEGMARLELLSQLGIDGLDVVDIKDHDKKIILDNLEKLPIHFASSAIMSLEELLRDSLQAEVFYEDLARDALLVDILTGQGLNSSGELALSAYSLCKAASIQGLELNTYTLDDLENITEPVLAFIDNGHYIVIKSVEGGVVTYYEPSLSKSGTLIQMDVEDFAWRYSGILVAPDPPAGSTVFEDARARLVKGGKDDGGGGGGNPPPPPPPPRLGPPLAEAIDSVEVLSSDLDLSLTSTIDIVKGQMDDAVTGFPEKMARLIEDYRLLTGVNFSSLTELSKAFLQMLPGLQVFTIPINTIDSLARLYSNSVQSSLQNAAPNTLNLSDSLGNIDTYLSCSSVVYDSDSRMLESTSEDGTHTSYEYDDSTGLIVSAREYSGPSLVHIYNYSYEDDLTIIEDETGSKKAYNSSFDLMYIENSDGSKYNYSIKNGLSTLTLINQDEVESPAQDGPYTVEYIYGLEGDIKTIIRNDGTRLNYSGGLLRTVKDAAGQVLIEYSYNESGELVDVRLVQAREDLEKQVERLNAEIILKGEYSLQRLTVKETLARINIHRTAQALKNGIAVQVAQLNNYISQVEACKPQKYKTWFGMTVRPDTSAWDGIQADIKGYIGQLNSAGANIDVEIEKALEELDAQVSFMIDELLPGEIDEALQSVESQRDSYLKQIEASEMLPLVNFYYRNLLGRDPGSAELEEWREYRRGSQGMDDSEYIKSTLTALSEYSEKCALRESVASYIRDYLTQEGRAPPGEINAIYEYLLNQSNHFASSAIGTLDQYLKIQGINIEYEDIVKEAVLLDILSGALNQGNLSGDLVISLDTISTICKNNGIDTIPAKVGSGKLSDIPTPFIAMINGDHFVVIKELAEGSITYYDPNIGPEGEDLTVAFGNFAKIFTGYILTAEENVSPASIIGKAEALYVRGGTFPFIGAVIGCVLGAIAAVAAPVIGAIGAIGSAIATIASTVAGVIGGIASSISGFLGSSSLFSSLLSFNGVGGLVSAGLEGMGASGVIGTVLSNVLPWAANFAAGTLISEGLGALGVNSAIINVLNGFVMGGPVGLVASGVAELGKTFGLDPTLTSILASGAGAVTGGAINGGADMSRIFTAMASGLVNYGIGELGDYYGLDPQLTSVLGSVGSGLFCDAVAPAGEKDGFFQNIFKSVSSELVNIALREAMESLPRSPGIASSLFASLGAESISGFLQSSGFIPEDPEDPNYTSSAEVLNLISSVEEGRITGDIWGAFQNGLSNKLFSGAVDSLSESALSVIGRLKVDLTSTPVPDEPDTVDAVTGPAADLDEGGNSLIDLLDPPAELDFLSKIYLPEEGQYTYLDFLQLEEIDDGGSSFIDDLLAYYNNNNDPFHDNVLDSIVGENDSLADLFHGVKGYSISYLNNTVFDIADIEHDEFNERLRYIKNDETILDNMMNIVAGVLNSPEAWTGLVGNALIAETAKEVIREYSDYDYVPANPDIQRKDNFRFVFVNGIVNTNGEGYSSGQGDAFEWGLNNSNISSNNIYLLPTYERGHIVKDALIWLSDISTNKMTNEIVAKMDYEIATRPESQKDSPAVATLYSGGYNPFMKALDERPDYNVETVIATGAAALRGRVPWMRDIKNPNVKTVVNIYGTKDILHPALTGTMKFNNVETINIKILGAEHGDYYYDPSAGPMNAKTSAFVSKVIERANLGNAYLKKFLDDKGNKIQYDSKTNTYTVDPNITDLRKPPEWRTSDEGK